MFNKCSNLESKFNHSNFENLNSLILIEEAKKEEKYFLNKKIQRNEDSLFNLNFDLVEAPKTQYSKSTSPLLTSTLDLSVDNFSLKDNGTEWFENECNDRSYNGEGEDYLTSWFVTN